MRKCDESGENLFQLWSLDHLNQIRLIGFPGATACISSSGRKLFIDECSISSETRRTSFSFVSTGEEDKIQIVQSKNNLDFGVGLWTGREFSRVKLFNIRSHNPSLDQWVLIKGFGSADDHS